MALASSLATGWRVATDRALEAVVRDPAAPEFLRAPLMRWLTWQVRNQTTVLQALRAPQLAPAWAANLVVTAAQVEHDGTTRAFADALARARPWQHLIVPLPLWPHAADWVARAPTDPPIVYAAAAVHLDPQGRLLGLRLALTGVSPRPVFVPQSLDAFVGRAAEPATWAAVAQAVAAQTRPKDDFRGSAEYRRAMAQVLTRRALQAAATAA